MTRSVTIAASRPGRKPRDMSPAAKRKRARYAARVLAHVCVGHPDHTAVTGVRCAVCRDNGVAAQRRLVAYRIENRLCRECGGQRGPDGTRCAKCRRRRRQRPSRQHAYRIKFERGYARRSERAEILHKEAPVQDPEYRVPALGALVTVRLIGSTSLVAAHGLTVLPSSEAPRAADDSEQRLLDRARGLAADPLGEY